MRFSETLLVAGLLVGISAALPQGAGELANTIAAGQSSHPTFFDHETISPRDEELTDTFPDGHISHVQAFGHKAVLHTQNYAKHRSPTSCVKGKVFDRIVNIWFENTDFENALADRKLPFPRREINTRVLISMQPTSNISKRWVFY